MVGVAPIVADKCYAVSQISMPDPKTEKLISALRESLGDNATEDMIASILATLDKQKVFRYHNEDTINILSTPGRVLCALMEDNSMTLRSIAVYLNMSEGMIDKVIKLLIASGLITKTKVNRQNFYSIHFDSVMKHPDIQHLLGAINVYPRQLPKPWEDGETKIYC